MPRKKRELSFHKEGRCWFKYRQKVRHYLNPRGCRKGDNEAYQEALRNWKLKLAQLEAEEKPSTVNTWKVAEAMGEVMRGGEKATPYSDEFLQQVFLQGRQAEREAMAQREAFAAENTDEPMINIPLKQLAPDTVFFASDYSDIKPLADPKKSKTKRDTRIRSVIADFVADKVALVRAGSLSAASAGDYKTVLAEFLHFSTQCDRLDINDVDSELLKAYKKEQFKRAGLKDGHKNKISPRTAHKRLSLLATFLKNLYADELLDQLPRTLANGFASVKVEKPTPAYWTLDEIHEIYKSSSPLLKVATRLFCECGYTPACVSSLSWETLDAETRIIDRTRKKTGVRQIHRLSKSTLKMLQEISTTTTGLILTLDGSPLLKRSISDNGGLKDSHDELANQFRSLKRRIKLKTNGRGMKTYRKNSSDYLAKNFKPEIAKRFLGHSRGQEAAYFDDHVAEEYYAATSTISGYFGFDALDTIGE